MNNLDDNLHMVLDQQAAMRREARLFRLARQGRVWRRRRQTPPPPAIEGPIEQTSI